MANKCTKPLTPAQLEQFEILSKQHDGDTAAMMADIKANIDYKRKTTTKDAHLYDELKTKLFANEKNIPAREALMSLMVKRIGDSAGFQNVENLGEAIKGAVTKDLYDFFDDYRLKSKGYIPIWKQDKEGLEDMVRVLLGGESKFDGTRAVSSKSNATALAGAFEELRRRFNLAGGKISKLDDWALPQSHHSELIRKAGPDAWKDFIRDKLDWERMQDDQLEFNGKTLDNPEAFLDETYLTVKTDGFNKTKNSGNSSKLGNRHQEHRSLHFKSPEDWIEYNNRFGEKDILLTINDHIDGMSQEIALMEVFGSNPANSYEQLKYLVQQDEIVNKGERKHGTGTLDEVFRIVSGSQVSGSERAANTMRSTRNYLSSIMLGGAQLSALSDIAFQAMTAARHMGFVKGAKTSAEGVVSSFLAGGKTAIEKKKLALRLGLTQGAWSNMAMGGNRFTDIAGKSNEMSAKWADFTFKLSGLNAWTDMQQNTFNLEFMGAIGAAVGQRWDRLDNGLKLTFKEYGITPEDWELMRHLPTHKVSNSDVQFIRGSKVTVDYFDPNRLRNNPLSDGLEEMQQRLFDKDLDKKARKKLNEEVAALEESIREQNALIDKFQAMVLTERDFAVPTPDARTRAVLTGGQGAGTKSGETARTLTMFKSFPVTLMLTHMGRSMRIAKGGRLAYAGTMVAATTALGALALQAKDISRGRTPREMGSKEFALASFMQGGGVGIFGDFFFSDQNRFGGGLEVTVAGPAVGKASEFIGFGQSTVSNLLDGEYGQVASDTINLVKNNTPIASSLWQTRVIWERVFEQAQIKVNPKERKKMINRKRRREKAYHQKHFWGPGQATPTL